MNIAVQREALFMIINVIRQEVFFYEHYSTESGGLVL
jgi:hypothetical protein